MGGDGAVTDPGSFSPKAVIATGSVPHPVPEAEPAARARLRALTIIYVLILTMATFWRCAVLRDGDLVLHYLDAVVIAGLGGVLTLLSTRMPVSLARLGALELGVVGLVAGRLTVVQYRLVLLFSQRGDPLMAQLIMKNVVLLTSVLILTYGLYVPKTVRRVALVVGPLALLPFATLSVLFLRHPGATGWLWRGWGNGDEA
jgi:serine/threonine-protein kinase